MSKYQEATAVAPQEKLNDLIKSVTTTDNLLDYKIKHLLNVLSENLELLHSEIMQEENKAVLIGRYNKLTALFEMFTDLLPAEEYFEKVNLLTVLLTQKTV